MRAFVQDVRYAVRQVRLSPGFSLTVVLTLALCLGAATTVFCVIDAVILKPLPFQNPERIVRVNTLDSLQYLQPASWPGYLDERDQSHSFEALAGYDIEQAPVETPAQGSVLLNCVSSTDNFFRVFGVKPLFGRTFLPGEDQQQKNNVVVLGYDTWKNYFNGDREVLGRSINIGGSFSTVIGVMPAGFRYPIAGKDRLYSPSLVDSRTLKTRNHWWINRVGRLKEGVSVQEAMADLSHVYADMGRAHPETDSGLKPQISLLSDYVLSHSKGPLWTLLGAVFTVLAIGCINVAGLLLSRGIRREREMAMRAALGASRLRLIRQVLAEGAVLTALGASAGVLIATLFLRGMSLFLTNALARGSDIHINWTVFGAALVLAVLTTLLANLYPALNLSAVDPNSALRSGGNSRTSRDQHKERTGFLVVQISLTMVLLLVSCLLLKMVTSYRHTELGFDPKRIVTTELNLLPMRYLHNDVVATFYGPLLERVQKLPGVQAAGFINMLPIDSYGNNSPIHIAGQAPYPKNFNNWVEERLVSASYFSVFGTPLHYGRLLNPAIDTVEDPSVAYVVNEAFVQRLIPSKLDPALQRMDDAGKPESWGRIVGVTGNIRQNIYDSPLPERDRLIESIPQEKRASWLASMELVIRYEGNLSALTPSLRNIIHEIDPAVPFKAPRRMSEIVEETLIFERMESWLFGSFASLALVLALTGIYGLISHEVEQSSRDIGVRIALGASRQKVLRFVLRRVAIISIAGVCIGFALSVLTRKLIGIVIYFNPQGQILELSILAAGLILISLFAAVLPALRAAHIDPMNALRME